MNARALTAGVALLLAAGCAALNKVEPGTVRLDGGLALTSERAWNRIDVESIWTAELWTLEGVPIDLLALYSGVRDGEPLVRPFAFRDRKRMPRYRSAMTPHEIVELFEHSVTRDGSVFRLERLEPARFAEAGGFRFSFTLLRQDDDLELQGLAYGTMRDGRLYLMAYRAPKTHFFAAHVASFEALVRSAKIAATKTAEARER
jgi:hypothetical protein